LTVWKKSWGDGCDVAAELMEGLLGWLGLPF
jgi:hypothetical protein